MDTKEENATATTSEREPSSRQYAGAASSPGTFVWDANTGREVERARKRKPTAEEIQRTLEIREAGGACDDCRKAKRRCTHVRTTSQAPSPPSAHRQRTPLHSTFGRENNDEKPTDITGAPPTKMRIDALKALAETLWEDLSSEVPILTEFAKGQYEAWIGLTQSIQSTANAAVAAEVASLESFSKECRRLLDEPTARDAKSWQRVRRFALNLIPSVAQGEPELAPWRDEASQEALGRDGGTPTNSREGPPAPGVEYDSLQNSRALSYNMPLLERLASGWGQPNSPTTANGVNRNLPSLARGGDPLDWTNDGLVDPSLLEYDASHTDAVTESDAATGTSTASQQRFTIFPDVMRSGASVYQNWDSQSMGKAPSLFQPIEPLVYGPNDQTTARSESPTLFPSFGVKQPYRPAASSIPNWQSIWRRNLVSVGRDKPEAAPYSVNDATWTQEKPPESHRTGQLDDACSHPNSNRSNKTTSSSESTTSYVCPSCGRKFHKTSAMKRHQRGVHSAHHLRPHKCTRCDWAFVNTKDLQRHVLAAHESLRQRYKCPVFGCVNSYSRQDNLRRHIARDHEDPVIPPSPSAAGTDEMTET